MGLFLYGTLRDPALMEIVAGAGPADARCDPVVLADHVVMRQKGTPLPMLMAERGGTAAGLLWRGLSPDQMMRLDAYEAPFGYTLRSVAVNLPGETDVVQATAYFPDETVYSSAEFWSFEDWQSHFSAIARDIAAEIYRHDPPLSGDELRRQWPMLERRAAAQERGKARVGPSVLRRNAAADDFSVTQTKIAGAFFKLAGMKVRHTTFAGGMSPELRREVLLGTDGALVLPYDPVSDNILLVEQFRMGPVACGALNPWTLEPIAGMVDAFETPEQAALREAAEEADLHDVKLTPMCHFYASPGNATDHFYCFLGLTDLPECKTYTGGLADEAEDLRLHIVPFDTAFEMIETGEIDTGPLITMLLWLDRNRDRLRSAA